MNIEAERSIPTLLSDVFGQLAKLIGNEFDLAKAELSDKAHQFGKAAAMIGVGALFLMPALVMLLFAVAAGLMHAGLSDPVAYLLTGMVTAAMAGSLVIIGLKKLSGDAMKPKIMIEQLQRDKAAAQEMVQ